MSRPTLQLRQTQTAIGPAVVVEIGAPEGAVFTPEGFTEAVLALRLEVPRPGTGAIIDGRAPVWGYAMLVHKAHAFNWIATRDPRLGCVVVATHSPSVTVGQVFEAA